MTFAVDILQENNGILEQDVHKMYAGLNPSSHSLEQVHKWANYMKDHSTGLYRHSLSAAAVMECLAKENGENNDVLHLAFLGGFLHDVGKLGIEPYLLDDRLLSRREYQILQSHVRIGKGLLMYDFNVVSNFSGMHHKKPNGNGYGTVAEDGNMSEEQKDLVDEYKLDLSIVDFLLAMNERGGKRFSGIQLDPKDREGVINIMSREYYSVDNHPHIEDRVNWMYDNFFEK